jgi:hypothetical protein
MARRNLVAVLSGVEPEGDGLLLRFTPRSGVAREIHDHVRLGEDGQLATVQGVGRLLRLLRAARIRAPRDPYALSADPQLALHLARRCLGSPVRLRVERRLHRVLTVWTESGVHEFRDLLDFYEDDEGLNVVRRGGRNALRVPRSELVRFEATTEEDYVVASIEGDAA